MIAADSPAPSAARKKALPIISRCGRPKETFDTPSTAGQPNSRRILRSASSVTFAAFGSALTAIVSGSNTRSSFFSPAFSASRRILSAISTRPSAVSGIPFSSSVRATTTPPYFFARGNTASMLSRLPFTELIIALPL